MATIYKAQTIGGRTAPDFSLVATEELPDTEKGNYDEDVYRPASIRQFDEQADIIVSAMIESLPGGTIDAVLIRLLQHRRSLFVVPYPRWYVEQQQADAQ